MGSLCVDAAVDERLETLRSPLSGHTHAAGSLAAPIGVDTGETGPAGSISALASVAAAKARGV